MGREPIRQALQAILNRREESPEGRVLRIPVRHILPNPAQPRRNFDDGRIYQLAESILRYGILQPLTVRRADELPHTGGRQPAAELYELIAGERRLRAAKIAGLTEVPCLLCQADDRRSAELALIENLQREDLDLFEQAGAISSLIDLFGLTQGEAAALLGLSQSAVANKLRLLRLTPPERKILLDNCMTERHARALLKLSDPDQRLSLLREAERRSLNVAQLEALVDSVICPPAPPSEETVRTRGMLKDIRIVFNTLDRAVDTIARAGIEVMREKREDEGSVEFVIRIPKPAVAPAPLLPLPPAAGLP